MPNLADLPYIAPARDTRFGVVTRLGCVWCLNCADANPDGRVRFTGVADHPDYRPGDRVYAYGGEMVGHDIGYASTHECDVCGVDLADAAHKVQADHDDQQRAWSRMAHDVAGEYLPDGTLSRFSLAVRCY